MASKSETGHAKNIANLKLFITTATGLGVVYNPSNADLKISNLNLIYDQSFADQNKVNIGLAPYTNVVAAREAIFEPFKLELTKIRRVFKATKGVTLKQEQDLMTIIRKYRGVRKTPKPKGDNPDELAKYHSVSQTSYDLRTNTFDSLIAFLENTPEYAPNEDQFKIATLNRLKQEMLDATDAVNQAFTTLNSLRSNRNQTLYYAANNLVKIATEARNYTLAILNRNQSEYKVFNRLIFKKIST